MINSRDQKLLMLLRQNARTSVTELAKAMHVSRSTVQNRIARLEASGVIRGYSVQLGGEFSASQVEAHVSIKVFQKLTLKLPSIVLPPLPFRLKTYFLHNSTLKTSPKLSLKLPRIVLRPLHFRQKNFFPS